MIRRLVGFWEYSHALVSLDQLVQQVTKEELQALNEYVKSQRKFEIEVNHARHLQQGASFLADPPDSDNVRRGLDWVMAFARVELGAMLAGFSDAKQPFEWIRPTSYEMEAYQYLLLDGVRSHYWALARDIDIPRLLKSSDIMRLLTYSRRLLIVRKMLGTAFQSAGWRLNRIQLEELKQWQSELNQMQSLFDGRLRAFLSSGEMVTTRSGLQAEYLTRVCGAILAGERAELTSGRAEVIYHQ